MSRVSISTGAGPGSSVSLAPETIRIRDALIEKFKDEPVDAMNQFMSQALEKETDEFRRLGILAARIYILRHRIANILEFNRNPTLTTILKSTQGLSILAFRDLMKLPQPIVVTAKMNSISPGSK